MTDDDLAAACIADEAANQAYPGKVAIGVVLRNRMAKRFFSDGTVPGTVLRKDQFSGFWFSMVNGTYTRVAFTLADAESRAAAKFATYSAQPIWADCQRAWVDAMDWESDQPLSFEPGPEFGKLDADTLNYANLAISSPAWATPDKLVAKLWDHSFFHA